jgi:hypothetical protein
MRVQMKTCKQCGSHAINPHLHGREPDIDLNLCDVCYWRERAEKYKSAIDEVTLMVIKFFKER